MSEPVVSPDKQELPEDFTSAWASVVLDLYERQKREQSSGHATDEPTAGGNAA